MPPFRLAVLAALAAGAAVLPSTAAAAPCHTSTAAAATHVDSSFDGEAGLAPEITTVRASLDSGCSYAVDPGVASPFLISGDAVFIYLDTDGSNATGSSLFGGADKVVGTAGSTYGDESDPMVGTWTGTTFDFTGGTTLTPNGLGGFRAGVDVLGIANGTRTDLNVGSIYSGIYDSYFDFAPEPSQLPVGLDVSFTGPPPPAPPSAPVTTTPRPTSTAAPAPPAAPARVPAASAQSVSAPPAPTTVAVSGQATTKTCIVPRIKGMALSSARRALKAAGCRIGIVDRYASRIRRGKVIGTSPGAGRRAYIVDMGVSRGRTKRKARAASSTAATLERLVALHLASR